MLDGLLFMGRFRISIFEMCRREQEDPLWAADTAPVSRLTYAVSHTIVDNLTAGYPLTSAHGHAQAGGAERQADQAGKGSDAGATRRNFGLQPAVHQRS